MASEDVSVEFVKVLTDHQVDLHAFIMSSLGDYSDTVDVLQRTNLELWKKASEFRSDSPFLPWALKFAKNEILKYMRKQRRDRHVFRPEVMELMVEVAMERSPGISTRSEALRECIKELSESNREFLRIRYAQEQSVKQVAEKTGRTVEGVKSLYYRIRTSLARCIDRKVASELR